jgi:predicted Zn-dependent protease with MMP-like domain
METIDLTKVAKVVDPDKKRLPYDKYKHLFTKIAFDVFHEDGKEYLSANYEREQEEKLQAKSSWEALSDKESKNITLLYKGVPIKRFASSEYGFESDDVDIFKNALVNKLSVNQEFVDKALVEAFPELAS